MKVDVLELRGRRQDDIGEIHRIRGKQLVYDHEQVLAAQALHLACALGGVDYACELGEFDRLLDDPFTGLEIEGGVLKLPAGPGSGIRRVKDSREDQKSA